MSRKGKLKTTYRSRVGVITFDIAPIRGRSKGKRFDACVWIGGPKTKVRRSDSRSSIACMRGSNPRRALAAALRSFAKLELGTRKRGAFQGRR